jgi:predicted transcriptional regulator
LKYSFNFGYYWWVLRSGGGNVNDKKTMTLNLTAAEMAALDELARRKDLTKTALIRQALRLYQAVDARVSQGEKLFFEDEVQKKKAELMVLG